MIATITRKDFDQIKFNYHLKGQISNEDAIQLMCVINRFVDELESRSQPGSEIYYEEEQRTIAEARRDLAHDLLNGVFNK